MIINIIIQARTSSKRFRSKVLINLFKERMILYFVKRLQNLRFVNKVIVATSNENSDNKLYEILEKNNIFVYRGPLNNVYLRYRNCLFIHKCDYFIRLSADSPFVNLNLIQKFIYIVRNNKGIDILTNIKNKTFPKGQSIEICNTKKFIKLKNYIKTHSEKEHVTKFFYNNISKFKLLIVKPNFEIQRQYYNSCIDYPNDIFLSKKFINNKVLKNLHKNLKLSKI